MKKALCLILSLLIFTSVLSASAPFARADADSAVALLFGESVDVKFTCGEAPDTPGCWVKFTPESSGLYQFGFKT